MSTRARSFGNEAQRYDRARPTYPQRLVDDLLSDGGTRVLDIGCGTGKASTLFTARGCTVLGVEPDARMAAVARAHGIEVDVTPFEDWDPRGRSFDLVVAGQAWHWLDHGRALPLVASVLRAEGRLAVFWNRGRHDAATRAAFDAAYASVAPQVKPDAQLEERDRGFLDAIAASPSFDRAETWTYERVERYSRDEWLDLLATQSNHILLEDDVRDRLLEAVGRAIDELGGELAVAYRTIALTALRA